MAQRPVREIMAGAPPAASKLLALIARQADHGPIHPKSPGVATRLRSWKPVGSTSDTSTTCCAGSSNTR